MWELPVFAVIATIGGLLGAGFVACTKRFALFRARKLAGAKRRFIEVNTYFLEDLEQAAFRQNRRRGAPPQSTGFCGGRLLSLLSPIYGN